VTRPFGIYVHFPWCEQRCPYCDFNTYVPDEGGVPAGRTGAGAAAGGKIPHGAYADAVLRELEARAPRECAGRTLRTIYFGGGTPGLWAPNDVGRVIDGARRLFGEVGAVALEEVTVECNPASSQEERFRAFVAAGADRFSIGCQSFDDPTLRALGRLHDGAAARDATRAARTAGARRVSLDLMFGCPAQSRATFGADLATAVACAPDHVSAYGLTIEPGTPFAVWRAAGRLALPDEDETADMLEDALAAFAAAGYERYEISNWARPGARAVHNTGYWLGGEYLGLGAGAHSMRRAGRAAHRRVNALTPAAYLAAPDARADDTAPEPVQAPLGPRGLADRRALAAPLAYLVPPEVLWREALMSGLRLREGVALDDFAAEYGTDVRAACARPLARAVDRGLASLDEGRLRLTDRGFLFADDVLASLL
jgi:oxygen-independent coproporphyrinogen-3 oxidase